MSYSQYHFASRFWMRFVVLSSTELTPIPRPHKYALAAGVKVDITRIERSVSLLLEGRTEYEFRTTVVPGILGEEDIAQIAQDIAGAQHYYLQQFVPRDTLDPAMLKRRPYLPDRVRAMADLARPWVKEIGLRGV